MTNNKTRRSKFKIVEDGKDLIIRDLGPHEQYLTVSNDSHDVVRRLASRLRPGQRLLYYDSDGNLDELKIKNGEFAGFAPARDQRPIK